MRYCSKCGKEINDEAVICVNCGCAVTENTMKLQNTSQQEDEVSVGLCILSALIPLVGIIYWPVKHRDTPKRAKACGITAIVAWVIYFVLNMAMLT